MMNVMSKIQINQSAINEITQKAQTALEETAKALQNEVRQAQVIPRAQGTLQGEAMYVDSSMKENGKVLIIHDTPYARRLYYHPEYNFHKSAWKDGKGRNCDGNPNAKGKWFEDWENGGEKQEFCQKAFEMNLQRLMR